MLREVSGDAVNSRRVRSSGSAEPLLTQKEQQQSQRLSLLAARLRASRSAPSPATLKSFDVVVSQCFNVNAVPLAPSAKGQCVSRHNAGVARRVLLVAQSGNKRAEVLGRRAADRADPRISYLVGMLDDDLLAGELPDKEDDNDPQNRRLPSADQGAKNARDIVRRAK